jgi:hypothetical protein
MIKGWTNRISRDVDSLNFECRKIYCFASLDPRKKEIDLSNFFALSVSHDLQNTNLRHGNATGTLSKRNPGCIAKHDPTL